MYEQREQSCTFLGRLVRDTKANVIALTAAIIIPMIGLVGGAVDASRSYATKSRLQSACDAGALAGRRTMGSGLWAANSNRANSQAQSVFSLNFPSGSFGSQNSSATFVESQGTVTGTATADVPMTLMKVFGVSTLTVNVTCTSMMVIPNTDVMFVLDTTGSMNCEVAHAGYTCTSTTYPAANAKIYGLRTAVKCFYEALSRLDTSEDCGSTPSGGLSSAVQLRFGFMPYTTNVNVADLLPTSYFADQWTFQSREPDTQDTWTWTAGPESARLGWGSWTPGNTPSSYNNASAFTFNGTRIPSSPGSVTVGGTTYPRKKTGTTVNSSTCASSFNTLANSSGTLAARDDVGEPSANITDDLVSSSTPTYISATNYSQTQTYQYSRTDARTVTAYRYRWFDPSGTDGSGCWLEYATATYNRTQTGGNSSAQLSWKMYKKWLGTYTYKARQLDISGLKNGSTWNSSVDLPLNVGSSFNVYVSGSKTATSIRIPADTPVTWGDGCIEEAYSPRNTDGDPSDEWSPIPDDAYDANIDLVPTTSNTQTLWGPSLLGAVWNRSSGGYNSFDPVQTTSASMGRPQRYCPAEAHKLDAWPTPSLFENYVDALTAKGSTYHDVGLIWGGRFMSPDGIFASENRTTPKGASIQRHMIFMTDGDTQTDNDIMDAHGVAWWDRRQTNSTYGPSASLLDSVVNARFSAVCDAIKNKNIILWVVSYGGGTNSTTESRLSQCASPGRYYLANDTPTLIANFQDIANKISALRLTN